MNHHILIVLLVNGAPSARISGVTSCTDAVVGRTGVQSLKTDFRC